MPSGGYSDKERQPVYQKALEICHEEEKELSLLQQDLERSKLQSFLSYKLEERHLRNELIRIKREQRRLAQEAKQRKKDNKSIDDIAKEIKARDPANTKSAAILFEKKFALPQINCTPKNVPKILRRKLSDESEYFTWTFGLPNIENRVKSFEEGRENKEKEKIVESKVGNDSEGANDDDLEIARGNTVHSIVFNIPVSPPREGKTQKQSLPSISIKTPITEVTSSEEDAHVCKNAENGPLGKLNNKKSNIVKLPKL